MAANDVTERVELVDVAMCRQRHQEIEHSLQRIEDGVRDLTRRLYVDNGHASIQTRLDRSDRLWKTALWVVALVVGLMTATGFRWIEKQSARMEILERSMSTMANSVIPQTKSTMSN